MKYRIPFMRAFDYNHDLVAPPPPSFSSCLWSFAVSMGEEGGGALLGLSWFQMRGAQ